MYYFMIHENIHKLQTVSHSCLTITIFTYFSYFLPSSSKINPKDSEKTSTFDDFSLSYKKHKENSSKVDVFWVSFGLNFEDKGAKCFSMKLTQSKQTFKNHDVLLYIQVFKYKVP